MEHEKEQRELFPQEALEDADASPSADASPNADASSNADAPAVKGVSAMEMREFRRQLEAESVCVKCGDSIAAENTILFAGQAYHKACLPFRDDLKTNPRITFQLSARASQLADLLGVLANKGMDDLYNRIADVLCEHDSWYARCAGCGKVVEKHAAIIGGIHTRKVKEDTGAVVSVPAGRFFSQVRSTEVFCSSACDLNYSKRLLAIWEKKQAEKAAAKAATKREEPTDKAKRVTVGLRALMKLAKTNKEVERGLAEILALMKE